MTGRMLSGQQRQVLDALRAAGGRGVHTFDLRHAGVGNPSQRLEELRRLGVVLRDERERLRGSVGKRFWLVSAPASLTPPPPSSASESSAAGLPSRRPCPPAPAAGDSGAEQLSLPGVPRAA